jgi:hypothetical protein
MVFQYVSDLLRHHGCCACSISDLLPDVVDATAPRAQIVMQILNEHPEVIPTVLETL